MEALDLRGLSRGRGARIVELQPELVLGTQMERHIAKRLGIPCAVISAPVHVQDFPARHSPQMGFEGANVDVRHLGAPADDGSRGTSARRCSASDFEFHDGAASVSSRSPDIPSRRPRRNVPQFSRHSPARDEPSISTWSADRRERTAARSPSSCAEKRGATPKRFAGERGLATITIETLYDAKAHFAR
jgi:light-independent protochlorophyllide reductase subunit B